MEGLSCSGEQYAEAIKQGTTEAATRSDGLCVQLYNSTTCSKKEKNTKKFVIYTLTLDWAIGWSRILSPIQTCAW